MFLKLFPLLALNGITDVVTWVVMDLQDSTSAKDAQYSLSVICLIAITYSLFYTLSKTCQSTSAFFLYLVLIKYALSLFHLALSWLIYKWHMYQGKEHTIICFFSFCFLLTQHTTCQRAARTKLVPKEKGAGSWAEHGWQRQWHHQQGLSPSPAALS